jgi:hypothetical protein
VWDKIGETRAFGQLEFGRFQRRSRFGPPRHLWVKISGETTPSATLVTGPVIKIE